MSSPAAPRVAIVFGSTSDTAVMDKAGEMLDRFGVGWVSAALSAHRAPVTLGRWLESQRAAGVQVVIAGAGMSAALPGVVASQTTMPVIGVPIKGGALDGLDALLSIAQMPPGVPVACVGLNAAANAGVLAVQVLALGDPSLGERLERFKADFEQAAADGLAQA